MRTLLLSIVITLSGCTSSMLDQRKLAYEAVDNCTFDNPLLYFSSTKQDLVITLAPLAQLTGVPCDKYTGAECDNIATAWLLIAPFTAVDTPFAFAKDIYMLPSDINHAKKMERCQASQIPSQPFKANALHVQP